MASNFYGAVVGFLYEGMNRVSYTAHEFWMMFNNNDYFKKVYFTNGTTKGLDIFLIWDGSTIKTWADLKVGPTGFPNNPYRFNDVPQGPRDRDFYQTVVPQFLQKATPRILMDVDML